MTLLLSDGEAAKLVDAAQLVPVLARALADRRDGRAVNGIRLRLPLPNGFLQYGAARWDTEDVFGYKVWPKAVTAEVPHPGGHLFLYRTSTGEHLATIDSFRVGRFRTAAMSMLAARTLIPWHDGQRRTLGVFGTGSQASAQIAALCEANLISAIKVFGRNTERRRAFAEDMAARHGLEVAPADSPQATAVGSAIVVTATSSVTPVVFGQWLDDVELLIAVGANRTYERELDETAVAAMKHVVVDDREQARGHCADIGYCVEAGSVVWEQVQELADFLPGGRTSAGTGPVLFESLGLSLTDVAAAHYTYLQATAAGAGTYIDQPRSHR